MASSSIEWTETTWDPVAGCTILSPGCTNCYAMRLAARLEAMGMARYAGLTRKSGGRAKWTSEVRLDYSALDIPKSWQNPKMIFVNSMSDLIQEAVPASFVAAVWKVMEMTPQHTCQILTKRLNRMAKLSRGLRLLPNVWLGASVENAAYSYRLGDLRRTLVAARFVSLEPLLSSVAVIDLTSINWAIVGGESGPRARPMDPEWVREIRSACRRSGTAFFFKQWGGRNKKRQGRTLDGKTWDEFPAPSVKLAETAAR